MPKRDPTYFKGRVCRKCNKDLSTGSDHGYILYDEKKDWDGKSYLCSSCRNYLKTYGTLDEDKIENQRKEYLKDKVKKKRLCCKCGNNYTYVYNGHPIWSSCMCNKKGCAGYICYDCNHIDKLKSKEHYLNKRKGRLCYICGRDLSFGDDTGRRDYDDNDNWTGKWVCTKCYSEKLRRLPDSYQNIIKSIANIRTGNIVVGSKSYLTIISQAVIAKFYMIDDLNIKTDNFNYYIDLESKDHGNIDVKAGKLTKNDGYDCWMFNTKKERKIDIHTFICIGFDNNLESINVVYIIPDEELTSNSGICIYKNTVRSIKYDMYDVDSEHYNNICQHWRKFLGDRKFIGIKDIMEWSNIYNEEIK